LEYEKLKPDIITALKEKAMADRKENPQFTHKVPSPKRPENTPMYLQFLELYARSRQPKDGTLQEHIKKDLNRIASSAPNQALTTYIKGDVVFDASLNGKPPNPETQENLKRQCSINTPHGLLIYNHNTKEGTSPLLPKKKNTFSLSEYQDKLFMVFIRHALLAEATQNPRHLIIEEEELNEAIDDEESEKPPNTKVFVAQIRERLGDLGKKGDKRFKHKLIQRIPNTRNYFFPTEEFPEIPFDEDSMLTCPTLLGEVKLDPLTNSAFSPAKPGIPIPLSPKEVEIILDLFTDPGYHKFANKTKKEKSVISVRVNKLNKKFGPKKIKIIESKKGLGWRFVPPKKEAEKDSQSDVVFLTSVTNHTLASN